MIHLKLGPFEIYGCKDVLLRLDDFIDRELPEAETAKVHFHLKICRSCAGRFTFEEDLEHGIRGKLVLIEVPSSLHEKLKRPESE